MPTNGDGGRRSRRLVVGAAFVAGLIAAAAALRGYLPLERLAEQEGQLRAWIAARPWTAFGVGLALYFVASLAPGSSGKSIVCGWLFGFWRAVVIVDVALTAAALTAFAVSRYVVRDYVHARFGPRLRRLDELLRRDGAFYLLTLRMLHAPYTLVNYGAGACDARAATFWWTTQLGLLPGTMVFVYVGSRLPTLGELVEHGPLTLLSPSVLAALALSGLAPIAIRWAVARWRSWSGAQREAPAGC